MLVCPTSAVVLRRVQLGTATAAPNSWMTPSSDARTWQCSRTNKLCSRQKTIHEGDCGGEVHWMSQAHYKCACSTMKTSATLAGTRVWPGHQICHSAHSGTCCCRRCTSHCAAAAQIKWLFALHVLCLLPLLVRYGPACPGRPDVEWGCADHTLVRPRPTA